MCKLRQVRQIFATCGHMYQLDDETIVCADVHCKFSPAHPPNCGPACRETCWQYRQFPEQYDRTFPTLCPTCQQRNATGAGRNGGR